MFLLLISLFHLSSFFTKISFNKVYYMKEDLQNFRYQCLKNIKMDGFLEDDLLLLLLLRRQRDKHIFWVRNIFRKRKELGEFHRPVQEL